MATLSKEAISRSWRTWEQLPEAIRGRLEAEGIYSAQDWRKAGPKRLTIWGVTRATARRLDHVAGWLL
jgi:hypothetical protein